MIDLEPDEARTEVAARARGIGDDLLGPAARDAEREGAVPKGHATIIAVEGDQVRVTGTKVALTGGRAG